MFPFYIPLKTTENLWFSGVFRGYKMGTLARNGLIRVKYNAFELKLGKYKTRFFNEYKLHKFELIDISI